MGIFGKPKGEEVKLKVDGMTCGHCVLRVTKALEGVKGVKKASVDLGRKEAFIIVEPGTSREELVKAVEAAGYKAN